MTIDEAIEEVAATCNELTMFVKLAETGRMQVHGVQGAALLANVRTVIGQLSVIAAALDPLTVIGPAEAPEVIAASVQVRAGMAKGTKIALGLALLIVLACVAYLARR